jgi:putative acetyltransferase
VSGARFKLRPYAAADEAAAIDLWRRAWQAAYPQLDFSARLAWWSQRWRSELVPIAAITVAERTGESGDILGFVTVDRSTGYLDQIVVAPEEWGSPLAAALIGDAKQSAPGGLDLLVNQDNARAIRFYEKQGFVVAGADVNPISGAALHRMSWRPRPAEKK